MKSTQLVCVTALAIGILGWPALEVGAELDADPPPAAALALPFIKLGRGLLNVGTGPLEIPLQIYRTGSRDGWAAGMFFGPIEGLGMVIVRTLGGAYEILTFPLPLPLRYQPMFEPEFLWSPVPPKDEFAERGSR